MTHAAGLDDQILGNTHLEVFWLETGFVNNAIRAVQHDCAKLSARCQFISQHNLAGEHGFHTRNS